MKKIMLPFLIFITSVSFSQIKSFTISLAPNVPVIGSTTSFNTNQTAFNDVREQYYGKMGFDAQVKVDFSISKSIFISTGVSACYLRFDRKIHLHILGYVDKVNGQQTTSLFRPNPKITAFYIGIPLLIGTSVPDSKLTIKGGPFAKFFLGGTEYVSTFSNGTFGNLNVDEKKERAKGFNSVLMGVIIQTSYEISKRMSLDLSYERYFSPIYSSDYRLDDKTYYNILSLGLSYQIPLEKATP